MLDRLDHVRIAVADPSGAAADYAALLVPAERPREAGAGAWRLEIGGVGVLLVPASDGAEGLQALVFAGAGEAPSEGESRGIAIEIVPGDASPEALPGSEDGAERLDHAVVITTDHEAAIALYRDRLGMRLALDRTFPKRGVRILFFRLAGVTVEVAGPIEATRGESQDPEQRDAELRDRFGGLAWRGTDLIAWRKRLLDQGFTVSEDRRGHKPGTRVCTVQDRTGGVPTLLIAPDPDAD